MNITLDDDLKTITRKPVGKLFTDKEDLIKLEYSLNNKTIIRSFNNDDVDGLAHILRLFNLDFVTIDERTHVHPWTEEQFRTICLASIQAFPIH